MATILDAKARLESEGLYVSCHNPGSLWIADAVRDLGDGIKMSDDACGLIWNADRWLAVFPADGLCTYELPGELPELVAVISAVYEHYRRTACLFKNAFRHVVSNADQYVVGRSLVRV